MFCELTWDNVAETFGLPVVRLLPVKKGFVEANTGVKHSPQVFSNAWTAAQRVAIGIADFANGTFDDKLLKPDGTSNDQLVGTVVTRVPGTVAKTVEEVRPAISQRITSQRNTVLHGDIEWSPDGGVTTYTVQTAEVSYSRMGAAQHRIESLGLTSQVWRMRDNQLVSLSAADFKSMWETLAQHMEDCYVAQTTHEAALAALTDPARVLGYDYTTGWPNNAPE